MKKWIMVLVLVAIIATGTVFADHPSGLGIGIVGNWGWGGVWGGALSLKIPSIPLYWGIGGGLGANGNESWFNLGLTGDSYLIDNKLAPLLHWFLGVGGWIHFNSYSWKYDAQNKTYTSTGIALGARIPIGLSLQPLPLLELFIDIAPGIGVSFWSEAKDDHGTELKKGGAQFPSWYFPAEIGIRLWF